MRRVMDSVIADAQLKADAKDEKYWITDASILIMSGDADGLRNHIRERIAHLDSVIEGEG